jgi:hypothetical protein
MCKRILSLILLFVSWEYHSYAQESNTLCTIKGSVKNQSGAPIPGANVQLINATDTSKVQTVFAMPDGGFELKSICKNVRLNVTMTGYEPYTRQITSVQETGLIEVSLSANYQNLTSVEVRASRRSLEIRTDRIVVNVEASASSAGTNVLELLEKSPGIAVDQDGVISMQGKQGVLILIDGKRNQLNPTELAAVLRSLSSAQVDQIELIAQPSARYDATGNAGVINIKMKRSKTAVFNGNITSSITQGRYSRFNQSITVDQRVGKAAFSLGYTGAYTKGFYDFTIIRKFASVTANTTDYFEQRTFNPYRQIPHNLRLNVDYSFNKKTSISLNHTMFLSDYKDAPETQGFNEGNDGKHFDKSIGSNHIRRLNYSIGVNFRTALDTMGREFTVDGDFFGYNRKNNQALYSALLDEQANTIEPPYHLKGYNPSVIQIAAGKMDYIHPFTKRWKAEAGLKYSAISTENETVFTQEVNGSWEPDARGNDFSYSERIAAGYINLSTSLKHWKLLSGLRGEATSVQARSSDPINSKSSSYFDLFPNLSLSFEKRKGSVFSLYYSRRIDRPSYQDMNPFQFVFNRYTYMQGNPGLVPQYSSLIEAGYAYKSNFNVKAGYTYTKDVIGDALFQDDVTHVTYLQKTNMAQRMVFSLNSTLILPVSNYWSVTLFGTALYTSFKGRFSNSALHNEAYSFNFNINNQFRFKKGWSGELSGSYFHKNYYTALFFDQGVYYVNAGVAKQIIAGKGTLRLAARDIFHTQYNRYLTDFNTMNIRMKQRQDLSNFTLAFSYRFGKTNMNPKKRNSSALEEMNRVGAN